MPSPLSRPIFGALVPFESAARLGSFSAAAREQKMSQPAISQIVAALEAELGAALFERRAHGVTLTEAGRSLYAAAQASMAAIGRAEAAIRGQRGRRKLVLVTDFGFASCWLMPRLPALDLALPGTDVRIVTAQTALGLQDQAADAAILFGDPGAALFPPGWRCELLFPEQVTPVCSPAFARGLHLPLAPAKIARLRRLHLQGCGTRWYSWNDWLAAHHLALAQGDEAGDAELSFGNYPLLLEAVMLGQGVALGWHPLVDDLLREKRLVAMTQMPLSRHHGYVLGLPPRCREIGVQFRQWALGQREAQAVT